MLTIKTPDRRKNGVFVVFLLLTLNIFNIIFYSFSCIVGFEQVNVSLVGSTHISLTFQIFCCKIGTAENIKLLFATSCDSNIISMFRFKKSNELYCVQDAKMLKLKDT